MISGVFGEFDSHAVLNAFIIGVACSGMNGIIVFIHIVNTVYFC